MSNAGGRGTGRAVVVALWTAAVVLFLAGLVMGAATLRLLQVIAGLCIIAAGLLVANDYDGVATAMGERSARRWRGRTSAPEASDPQVAARASRFMAWVWVVFGGVVIVLAIGVLR